MIPWRSSALRHLEGELMALIAEVLRLHVAQVAAVAVEVACVVRRDVRVGGLDALRLFNEGCNRVAALAGLRGRFLGIGLVGAVAHLAGDAAGDVAVGKHRVGGKGGRRDESRGCQRERCRGELGANHWVDS